MEVAYSVVPAAERLSLAGVFADATPVNQAMMAILIAATLGSVAIWAMSLPKVGKGDGAGLAVALGRLKIVRSAGAMLGLLGASYCLLNGFIGLSNVRPVPTASVMAPGWAEATFLVMLGLLASTVAVICERHLEAKIARNQA
jgi:hypothetical protein